MAFSPSDTSDDTSLPAGLTPAPLLRAVFDNTTTAISVKDARGTYVAVNPTCASLWGLEPGDIVGRSDHDLLPEATANQRRAHDELVMTTGEPQQREETIAFVGGEPKTLLSSKMPIVDGDGRVTAVCDVATEITGHRRVLDELSESQRLLDEQESRREEFLATLAHELRNPLAPIRSAAEVLAMRPGVGAPDELTSKAASVILRQVSHMARLIDDLLVVSRLTQGHIELQTSACHLDDVIQQAVEMVRPVLAERDQRVEMSMPEERIELRADGVRLVQVLGNLLENAALCSDHPATVRIHVSGDDESVTVTVADEGRGMHPAQLKDVFDPMDRTSGSLGPDGLATGLGLVVARHLVELHGGTLCAHSEGPNRGSELTMHLPKGTPATSASTSDAGSPETDPRRVLVVDDNEDAALMLAMLLEARGDDVAVCHLGGEAPAAAREHAPDVVLLDIGLPDMNGRDVAAQLREEHGADLQLVAVTGYGRAEDERKSLAAGFDAHIVKPITLDALLSVIE